MTDNSSADRSIVPEQCNVSSFPNDLLQVSSGFIHQIPLPVFIKDHNSVYIACNQLFANIFGFTDTLHIIGKTTHELLCSDTWEEHDKSDKRLLEEGATLIYESHFPVDTDNKRIAQITKSFYHSPTGERIGIIGIINDISSLKAMQNQQLFYNKHLEETVDERTKDLIQINKELNQRIEEKLNSEKEMLRFENRLEIALTALRAGAWEWNTGDDTLEWSEKCFEIFGLEPGKIHRADWLGVVHPDDFSRVRTMWGRIIRQTGWFDLEFRILVEDIVRWIRKSGYYFLGKEGESGKVIGVMVDITEEKYFNERLLESQQFFQAVVEDQTEMICRIKPDGSFTFANQAFARFFNQPTQHLLLQSLGDVIRHKEYSKIKRLFNLVKPSHPVVNFDLLLGQQDSEPAMVQWTIRALYNDNGFLNEYQFVGRDVTDVETSREALRQSEEMFRLIAENSNDIISIYRNDGTLEYVSPSISSILGYSPVTILGKKWNDFVFKEDWDKLESIDKQLEINRSPILVTIRFNDQLGKQIWFESMVQLQLSSSTEPSGKVIAVSRNIHSRKLAEEQQLITEKQLQEANNTKDKFFSIIAHDLRSPFTSILGFSRLLNEEYEDFTDDDRKMMVQQILISTENTFQLLDNLLAWAKTQLGHTRAYPEDFELMALVNETVMLSRAQAQSKNIDIRVECAENLEVISDVNMTKTVLRNLLSNAIKYSYPDGTIDLCISREDNFARICIADHGTGMEEFTLKALFSIGQKVTSIKGTANEKGTGLGLILAKEFVEQNGGTILAESQPGKGSLFCFTLPLFVK